MYLADMSDYRRPRLPRACIFFTVGLADRKSDLLLREVGRLRDAVALARVTRPFRIEAWVVLPDHLHAVWTLPEGDYDYSVRWAAIKAGFSRGLPAGPRRDSHLLRREKGIWQRRFWEQHLRSDADRKAGIRYCWGNPVEHGYVDDPADWPYSSFHRDAAIFQPLA